MLVRIHLKSGKHVVNLNPPHDVHRVGSLDEALDWRSQATSGAAS